MIPLLMGNLFQQLYNLIDSIIVGRFIGINALASVGASASITFLILGFVIGTCSGFAIPVAQSFGAKQEKEMRKYIFNAMFLSAVLAVIITVLTSALCYRILVWMGTPTAILQGAYEYLIVIFIGIPFTFLYNMLSGIIRSLGDSRTPFIFLIVSTIVNIIGDLLLILVFGLGVMGAGIATIFAGMALFVIPRFGYAAACFTDPSAWVSAMVFLSILFFYVMKKIQKQHTDDEQSVVYAMEN